MFEKGHLALYGGGSFSGGVATNGNGLLQLNSGSYTINGTVSGTNVVENGGDLVGTNSIQGTLQWWSGVWTLSPITVVTVTTNSALWITTSTDHDLWNCTLTNHGTVSWMAGRIRGGGAQQDPGTSIYNYGLWDVRQDGFAFNDDGGWNGTVFNNAGTLRKSVGSAAGNTPLAGGVWFNQLSGIVEVKAGNLVLQGGGRFSGGTVPNSGGTVQLNAGNFTINGVISGDNLIQNGGNLAGANLIQGALQWQAGSWNGVPSVTLNSGSVLYINGTADHDLADCYLTNNGSVFWSGGRIRGGGASHNPGTFVLNNGSWEVQGDLTFNDDMGWNGTVIQNLGRVRKTFGTGAATFTWGVTVLNRGEIDAQCGKIALAGGYDLADGTRLSFGLGGAAGNGSIALSGPASFTGSLSVNLNGYYWPAAGDSFNLLEYTSASQLLFTNMALPSVNYLAWQTNYAQTAFALSLRSQTAINTAATNLSMTIASGGNLLLQWPGDHTGCRLLTQVNPTTVGLSTNWVTIPGSQLTNQMLVPITTANGSTFFRLASP